MNEYGNDEKIKKALENEPVPEELSPESIKIMLDEKAPSKKRSKIKIGTRIAAGAAACAVISGTAVYVAGQGNLLNKKSSAGTSEYYTSEDGNSEEGITSPTVGSSGETEVTVESVGSYMSGAESYEQIYTLFGEASERAKKQNSYRYDNGIYTDDYATGAIAEEAMEDGESDSFNVETATTAAGASGGMGGGDDSSEYYETYDQEEGVREADIVKTDGEYIYYITNKYVSNTESSHAYIRVAGVDSGTFTSSYTIDLNDFIHNQLSDIHNINLFVSDMYLYNDMLIAIGWVDSWSYDEDGSYYSYNSKDDTFVSFFTAGEQPQYIDTYYQEGYFSDVRVAPDGYMYLISNYSTASFSEIGDMEQYSRYIPTYCIDDDTDFIAASDILLPNGEFNDSEWLSYTVIGSLDLNETGVVAPVQTKALAGYSGTVYCSSDNMYTAYGWDDTDITRIAIGAGEITPAASCEIEGRVKDQFSMSEYNGYFRVAATKDTYEEKYYSYDDDNDYWWDVFGWVSKSDENGYYTNVWVGRDNRLYVLDLDLNLVGSVEGFGENEEVKSVSFSGDMAYVVTYEQTDPLFAIDLSEPTAPTILDELTLPGYSTYMQQWDDGLLLGFGVIESDWEAGLSSGVKLVMFDNSDPNALAQVGEYIIRGYDNGGNDEDGGEMYVYSSATNNRKALMIAPEKNLIGFPIWRETYNEDYTWSEEYSYLFFSYENGEFVQRGEITVEHPADSWYDNTELNRALYIGDYVYVTSGDRFFAADIESLDITDTIEF